MWIDLLFNRLGRNSKRILDRERGARTMRDDADAIYAEEWRAAVFLVVHLFLDRLKRFLREKSAGHPYLAFDQLVLKPFENGVADRFTGLENDVADEAVTNDNLDGMSKQIMAFDVAPEVERAPLQHLENLFR